MIDWLSRTLFLHNSVRLWLVAIVAGLIGYLVVDGVLRFLAARLRRRQGVAPNTPRQVALTLLAAMRRWIVFALVLLAAADLLTLPPKVEAVLGHLGFALAAVQIALCVNSLVGLWFSQSPGEPDHGLINPVLVGMLTWTAQLVVWAVVLLAFLNNVGVNITAFVASLGVGGIAVALGLQTVLGDLFSSVAIGLDKPFEVGNFIAFGSDLGTVEHVGVKTTRIASLSGEQLVISNSNLLKELVHNYSRMPHRRVVFGFRLPYATTREQAQRVVDAVRGFIGHAANTRFDRGHLANFGEFGLEFEFVYYVLSADYTEYRDIQQAVNFGIMDLLGQMQVPFAVPARALHMTEAVDVQGVRLAGRDGGRSHADSMSTPT